MARIAVQGGHLYRRSGATGGWYEQYLNEAFARRVTGTAHNARYDISKGLLAKSDDLVGQMLKERGHEVHFLTADQAAPSGYFDAFISCHCDASNSGSASGASVGYPSSGGYRLAQAWKKRYREHGWPYGFLRDNYTNGLRYYYYYKRIWAGEEIVVEHGFTSNKSKDFAFMTSAAGQRASALAIVDAIGDVFGHPKQLIVPTGDDETMDMTAHKMYGRAGQRWINSVVAQRPDIFEDVVRKAIGKTEIAVDGIAGKETRGAMHAIQKRLGLAGVAGNESHVLTYGLEKAVDQYLRDHDITD